MYSDYYDSIAQVAGADPEVAAAMNQELQRQRDNIELIASENLVSPAVMAAMGSVLTNKYAEGLPGKRYSAAASMWMWWRRLPLSAPANCLVPSMPMCSPTPVPRPTRLSICFAEAG